MRKDLRTYVTVNLDAIADNLREVRKKAGPGVKVMAVIKTDAYGHGAAAVSQYLYAKGLADWFAVASINEAVELRQAGITLPILILGYTMHAWYPSVVSYNVAQTIYSVEDARLLSLTAIAQGTKARVHIAVDTGMGRIGFMPDQQGAESVCRIAEMPGLILEGMFTHFSTADETDKTYTMLQMDRYDAFVDLLEKKGIHIPLKHVCNSAAIMEFDHHRYDMVRSGIITYGLYPSEEVVRDNMPLRPALEWKAHVVHVKTVGPGLGISYGKTYVTSAPETRIATIGCGYGDGYPRALSGKGRVLIHGRSVPILGRVCMDQFMVDVTGIDDVAVEDEVTLIGREGDEMISVEEAAALAGSFNYEFVCDIGKRAERIYITDTQVQANEDT
ncbi:MAG: alanine racemase [Lachnospiraceae bacterium]